jgi:hypothetical protein
MSRQVPGDLEKAKDICTEDLKGHKVWAKPTETGWKAIRYWLKADFFDLCDPLFAFPFSASRWKVKGSDVVEDRCIL